MRRFHIILILLVILVLVYFALGYIPARASLLYGPPARGLSITERIEYSTRLLAHGDLLTTPLFPNGIEQRFQIEQGEAVLSIVTRLEEANLISDAQAFYDYLVYTGLDLTLQAGDYTLSPSFSIIDIAQELQDATPEDVTLVILPGWRMEEIAASLPTSGLGIAPEEFLRAAQTPAPAILEFVPLTSSMEGFFLPDVYILPRVTPVEELLELIARNFALHITDDLRAGFTTQGLNVFQAVTLASLVERESIQEDEQALIASVFINRLNIGMHLGSDPTVQYALGYDLAGGTWWKNPLSLADLQYDSPYNTYVHTGLPPGPIASPSLEALRAVAFPEISPYYYFRAKCDGSGYHIFAVTLEEQITNGCE
jgi:UPF0755 protein